VSETYTQYGTVTTKWMCGRKCLYQVRWHCLTKLCTKNYKNPSKFLKLQRKNQWHLLIWIRVLRQILVMINFIHQHG